VRQQQLGRLGHGVAAAENPALDLRRRVVGQCIGAGEGRPQTIGKVAGAVRPSSSEPVARANSRTFSWVTA
jgi:hypothetical protein